MVYSWYGIVEKSSHYPIIPSQNAPHSRDVSSVPAGFGGWSAKSTNRDTRHTHTQIYYIYNYTCINISTYTYAYNFSLYIYIYDMFIYI